MTATILLVRHAAHAELGRVLSGRSGNVTLSAEGIEEARRLAQRLAGMPLHALHTSPVRRARQTAEILAEACRLPLVTAPPLEEVDFGAWSGQSFAALAEDAQWQFWNTHRGEARAPGGESMAEVQQRVIAHLRAAARGAAGMAIAMVSHADVIRAAVAGILGLSLSRILAFDIDPASVTRIAAGPWGERVLSLNEQGG